MRAMHLILPDKIETNPLHLVELPIPEPGPGEIRVKVSVCGLCHTDLHTVEGDLTIPSLPLIPGHQIIGTVNKVGAGVIYPQLGARVGIPWLYSTCGICGYCRTGMENLCSKASFTGFNHPGGYAEYTIAQAAYVEPLPNILGSDEQLAPLLCAGIIGYRALHLSGVRPGERIGLYGFGASAHLAIQIARYWGCKVYVFSRNFKHLNLAKTLGAVWTGQPLDQAPHLLDRAINFTPAGDLIPLALENLRPGGTLALAGIFMDKIPEMNYQRHLYFEKSICSVTNATRQDAAEFMQLAADIPIRTDIHQFPLEEANEALRSLKESRIPAGAGVLKVG